MPPEQEPVQQIPKNLMAYKSGSYHISDVAIAICNDYHASPSTLICILKTQLEVLEGQISTLQKPMEPEELKQAIREALKDGGK
jgi:hypothetical protein